MTKKMSVQERLLSKGFKIAEPTDPIYQMGWTAIVNPFSRRQGKPLKNQARSQDSKSENAETESDGMRTEKLRRLKVRPMLKAHQGQTKDKSYGPTTDKAADPSKSVTPIKTTPKTKKRRKI